MQSMPAMPPTSGNMRSPQGFQSMPPMGGPQGAGPPMTNFGAMGNVPRTSIPGPGPESENPKSEERRAEDWHARSAKKRATHVGCLYAGRLPT
ncbi:unnamed protein product, partial [Effrenium voratum]